MQRKAVPGIHRNKTRIFHSISTPADWPLAYKRGYQWFFYEKYFVNENVLIPRPETELLVELALEEIKNHTSLIVADIGTGSGCIIVSTAKHSKQATFFASDLSNGALSVAKKNAANLLPKNKEVIFAKGDLAKPFLIKIKQRKNLLILSNLPYLTKEEMKEPSIKHEPKLALFGATKLIQKLLKQLAAAKITASTILLEIGYNQAGEIKKMATKLWPKSQIKVYKDLNKFNRVVKIKLP